MSQELSKVAKAKSQTEPGRYGLGDGLYLQVSPTGTKSYIFRYKLHGRSRHMGLGSANTLDLKEARKRATKARLLILDGIDPLAEKDARADAERKKRARTKSFADCAAVVIENKTKKAKNAKHIAQWTSTLETYVYPTLGKRTVGDISKHDVVSVLRPIWDTKHETASRIRGRMEAVFDYAKAMGYREGDNPAAWKGNLEPLLETGKRIKRHQPSLPYARIPEFMAELRTREGVSARALEFAILTAARSGEVLGATWDEIDLDAKVWTIPAARMKAEREHDVPLSEPAIALLKATPRVEGTPHIFPAMRGGKLSDMALSMTVRRINGDTPKFVDRVSGDPVVPHGFRSTFREYAGNMTAHPREVIEHALAHRLPDAVERAYQRSTLLPKRALLMADWAAYCERPPTVGSNVVPLAKANA